jgi:thiol-disulfide isomerase/thioredoxin
MMKKLLLSVLSIFTLSACSAQEKFSKESLSSVVLSQNGQKITLEKILNKHKGKTVVIEFWASWCGDCVKAMPKVKDLQSKFADVDFVFLSLDKNEEKWKSGIEKHQLNGDHYLIVDPNGMKGSFGQSVKLDWIPRYMILDKSGEIKIFKAIETDFDLMNETLNNLK